MIQNTLAAVAVRISESKSATVFINLKTADPHFSVFPDESRGSSNIFIAIGH